MSMDLSGLKNFQSKIRSYNVGDFASRILKQVLELAVQYANEEYARSGISDVEITSTQTNNSGKLIVSGEQIAYIEFGTGEYAKGTYEGTLPQSGVPITGKWEYYYDSDSKVEINGKKGWWFGVNFSEGKSAGNQMYRVSKRLRQVIPQIIGVSINE